MRLIEAVVNANNRAARGEPAVGLHMDEFADSLPVVALTCIDVRLNPLIPEVLGIPEEHFIWLRNAGNIITGPLSSTVRSLALACAVKGGREILVIGHSDCQVAKTTVMQLIEAFNTLGIERNLLPENITQFFGTFSSERQNVINAASIVRQSPIISPRVPVHGILVDTTTGKLDWLLNGYENMNLMASRWNEVVQNAAETLNSVKSLTDFRIGAVDVNETRIGETVTQAADWLTQKLKTAAIPTVEKNELPPVVHAPPAAPPPIAASFKPKIILRRPRL